MKLYSPRDHGPSPFSHLGNPYLPQSDGGTGRHGSFGGLSWCFPLWLGHRRPVEKAVESLS